MKFGAFYKETNFRETPLGRISKDWNVVRLEEVSEINPESIDPIKEIPNKEFLYIDIESVEEGIIKSPKQILGKNAPSRARRVVRENDVIMSTVRPYLKAFAPVPKIYDDQICSTGFAVLRSKQKITHLYLFYTLLSEKVINQCNTMMVGGQYPALNQSQVAQIRIPLPLHSEQQKIAEILSLVDATIQKVDEIIAKTETLKKGLMQELLTKGIGHKEFKDTEIGKIPKDWEVVRLGDLCVKITDGTHKTPKYQKTGVPFLSTQNLIPFRKGFDFSDYEKYISAEEHRELVKRCKPEKRDILISKCGTIGRTKLIDVNFEFSIFVGLALLKLRNKDTGPFLEQLLNFEPYVKRMEIASPGATRKTLTINAIENFKIPLPLHSEQQKIAKILSTIDRKLEVERAEKVQLEKTKRGLMDLLLTGKVRVRVN